MSYILDALKKSEQERDTSKTMVTPRATAVPAAPVRTRSLLLGLSASVILALALLFFWYQGDRQAAPPAVVTAPVIDLEPARVPDADLQPKPEPRALEREIKTQARPISGPKIAPVKPAPAIAHASLDPAQARFLREMPEDFQRRLPPLNVEVHVYSPGGASILYINNHEYHPGESMPGGLRVEAIVPEGAVLNFQGQLFKLPRPNR